MQIVPDPIKGQEENSPSADASQFEEITLDDVAKVLSLTIKDDDSNKKIVFLAMLSAYTDKSQINVSLNAPSSTGKTYLATQIAKLFPDEDKIERSGASPTSFFYGDGIFDKERNAKIVSLKRKILIFYEQPNPALQEKLRALLSHDSREVTHSLTNKKGGRNQTDTIILEGFAATIFCSAGLRLDEQEATRAILLSPEATEAKIKQAVHLQFKRGADEAKFEAWLNSQPERIELMHRIKAIRDEHVNEIIIPNEEDIERRFLLASGKMKPRHSRDSGHLIHLIKAIALLNVWYRRNPDGKVVANQSDIDQAFKLWNEFFESQNLNVPPAVMSIYKKYIVPAYLQKYYLSDYSQKMAMDNNDIGLSSQELNTYHVQQEGSAMDGEHLRKQILPQLESAGVITVEKPQGDDKRSRHIFPTLITEEDRNKVGNGGMDSQLSDEDRKMLDDFNRQIS